jgi:hypothetical protein
LTELHVSMNEGTQAALPEGQPPVWCPPAGDRRFTIEARCHPAAGFDAAVDDMSRLVLRCRACDRPVLTLAGWELDPLGSDL